MRNKGAELINLTCIHEEIEKVKVLLDAYQFSARAKKNRYEIRREFDLFRIHLFKVQQGLADLKDLSIEWEHLE